MSRDYPDWIDPLKAAQGRRSFAGTIPLARLERLHDIVADPTRGELDFAVSFSLDDHGNVRAEVQVAGELPLICQRSLKGYRHPVNSRSVLGIVSDERAAAGLPEDYEPLLVEQARVRIEDLVAEELLLSLPLVPLAPDSSPIGEHRPVVTETYKPFADLADLAAKAGKSSSKE